LRAVSDKHRGTIRPEFDRSISIDFQGAKITSDTGFLLMREMDQRLNLLGGVESLIDDPEDKLTNCGRRCVGKSQKPVQPTFELRIVLGKLYAIGGSGVNQRFIRQKSGPKLGFRCKA
jgi:hypothetical protein